MPLSQLAITIIKKTLSIVFISFLLALLGTLYPQKARPLFTVRLYQEWLKDIRTYKMEKNGNLTNTRYIGD